MAITVFIFSVYRGACILSSWSHSIFFFQLVSVCVSLCVRVFVTSIDVVVSLVITICVSLTVWSGKAHHPAAHSALCWNP